MNKLALLAAAAITAATFGSVAIAQDMETAFVNADGNKDKVVSYDEAQGAVSTLTPDQFATADANGDGTLDEGEFIGLLTLFGTNDSSSSAM